MTKLDLDFKVQTAKTLTELAIQHALIPRLSNSTQTANAVCEFFQTIVNNLDNKTE